MYLGEAPANKKPVARNVVSQQASAVNSEEPSVDIPEVVVNDSMDGTSLRERKMAKVAASRQEESNEIAVEPDDDLEEIAVTVEEVHVADEFVVEVSPQSIEDANIAAHIQEKETVILASVQGSKKGVEIEWPKSELQLQRCGKSTVLERT